MGKINGIFCHCTELAGGASRHLESLKNSVSLLILAVDAEEQKGREEDPGC